MTELIVKSLYGLSIYYAQRFYGFFTILVFIFVCHFVVLPGFNDSDEPMSVHFLKLGLFNDGLIGFRLKD